MSSIPDLSAGSVLPLYPGQPEVEAQAPLPEAPPDNLPQLGNLPPPSHIYDIPVHL